MARSAKELAEEIGRLKKPEIALLKNSDEAHRNEKEIQRLEAQRARLLKEEAEARERAKQEQAAGDGIYWPIFNLDIKNPSAKQDFEHLPPEQLADDILRKEQRIAELMAEIKQMLAAKTSDQEETSETASHSSAVVADQSDVVFPEETHETAGRSSAA